MVLLGETACVAQHDVVVAAPIERIAAAVPAQGVVAGAAIDIVVAVKLRQGVGILAADADVALRAVAIQEVGAIAPFQGIVSRLPIEQIVFASALQQIVAIPGEQRVVARAAVEHVRRVAFDVEVARHTGEAGHAVGHEDAEVGNGVRIPCREKAWNDAAAAQQNIAAIAAGEHVAARAAVQNVVALVAFEVIVIRAALQRVVVDPAVEFVVAVRGDEDVVAGVTVELLIARAIGNVVDAGAAIGHGPGSGDSDPVVAVQAIDLLERRIGAERVVGVRARQVGVDLGGRHAVDVDAEEGRRAVEAQNPDCPARVGVLGDSQPRRALRAACGSELAVPGEREIGVAEGLVVVALALVGAGEVHSGEHDLALAVAVDDGVCPVARIPRIGIDACAAQEQVLVLAANEFVVALPTVEPIPARVALQVIGPAQPAQPVVATVAVKGVGVCTAGEVRFGGVGAEENAFGFGLLERSFD